MTLLAEGGSNGGEVADCSRSWAVVVEPVAQESTPIAGIQVQNVNRPSGNDKMLEIVSPRVNHKSVAETLRIDLGLHGSGKSLVITVKDTVVAAPTSLSNNKHKAIRVVEECFKRILQDNNGCARYGLIRKIYSKGANRNVNPTVDIL
ncbi:hypothetical protein V6N11_034071 [Hibiscus sabdariffa]|uniref:Uncharacterized protein n=1 Tax=Hibiscus sabdariffa TaxID=183260 RepID=A0ABR2S1B0_9ROSI